jgi:putative ABC transport system substrate-binding protein
MLLMAGVMTAARALRAPQRAMPVIGFLGSGSPIPNAPFVAALRQGLTETGYVEGKSVAVEYRWAEGSYERLPALATDLVRRKVDVIVTSGTPRHWLRKPQPRRSRSSSASAIRSSSA